MLAEAEAPLVLADGTKIDPSTGRVIRERKFVEVPRASDAQRQVTAVRRTLAELPMPPKTMPAIAVVMAYTLWGLSDEQIALGMEITLDQVRRIKMSEAYSTFYTSVAETLVKTQADDVRSMIAQQSQSAVQRIVELMDSDREDIVLSASKDLLDRAGHRPTDVVEHRHSMEGGLRIEIVDKTGTSDMPIIDLEVEK